MKSPGDGLDDSKHNGKCWGFRASNSSMPSLFGVSGRWLKIDSTSQRKVVIGSSVNKCCLVTVFKACFTVLTKTSQTLLIHALIVGLNSHLMSCLLKVWAALRFIYFKTVNESLHVKFIESLHMTFKDNFDYYFSRAVFLPILSLVHCKDTAFSL